MKKTFREKLIVKFTGIARAHRSMKYPCLTVVAVVLFFYHILMHFVNNGKRYASVVFVAIFFMSSCSFSFAVFAERTGFISTQETYSAIVEDSDITLAEQPVNPQEQIILEENTAVSECETEEDSEEMVAYSLDDLLAHREGEAYQAPSTDIEDTGEEYVFSSSDWRLVLINKQHPIPEEYDFTLGTFTAGMRCDERIIEDLLLMMQAAKADGVNLEVCSPYRGDNRQEYLFNRKIKNIWGRECPIWRHINWLPRLSLYRGQASIRWDLHWISGVIPIKPWIKVSRIRKQAGGWQSTVVNMDLSCVIPRAKSILPVLSMSPGISDMWAERQP